MTTTDPRGTLVLEVAIPTNRTEAVEAMRALADRGLIWHPEDSATEVGNVRHSKWLPLFSPTEAEHAQAVMDAVWRHHEDPCALALDLLPA